MLAHNDSERIQLVDKLSHLLEKVEYYPVYASSISKVITCQICNKKTVNQSSFNEHMLVHQITEKQFLCSICGALFYHIATVTKHEVSHGSERAFSCDICDKKFKDKAGLRKHKIRHAGVKRFACSFCDKMFLIKPNLTLHLRTHTGEKPYACRICGKKFAQRSNRGSHEKTHK